MIFNYLKKLSDKKDAKTIIMLHGVGSNKEDLFSLSSDFSKYNVFSLNGPIKLGNNGFAWYKLDFSTGKLIYNFNEVLTGYDYIVGFIKYISGKYEISYENIYLFGFSQGAIMSYYLLWKNPELIAGIIALSGRLLSEIDLSTIEKVSNKKVFVGHGIQDNVIGVNSVEGIKVYTINLGITPTVKIYNMPHTIIKEEIDDIVEFLG